MVTVNAGYGTYESKYDSRWRCSIRRRARWPTFPMPYTGARAKQTLYSGLAFSRDGSHLYASMGSIDRSAGHGDEGRRPAAALWSISFSEGKIAPERFIHLPMQQLAPGRKTLLIGEQEGDKGVPFPAAIAVVGAAGAEKLLVADNLSDDVLLLDPATGRSSIASICRRAMRFRRLIRWRWRCRRMASARLWRCGMRRRLWSST